MKANDHSKRKQRRHPDGVEIISWRGGKPMKPTRRELMNIGLAAALGIPFDPRGLPAKYVYPGGRK